MHMNFTGERFIPQLRGQIYYEHFHRYAVGLPMIHDKDVLDIACGEGYGAAFLAMSARSVIGIDIDEMSIRHAAASYPAMNLSFRAGSASQIPLADAAIDVITCFETIEHLVEHEQMLREMVRVLRPNGRLLISSPNRLVYSDARGYSNPFHVRELYFHEFRDLLRGFFPEVHIYGQRIFAACAIHPIGASTMETRWLGPNLSPETGIPGLPDPEYFVAVCGRLAGEDLPNLSTVYLDLRDDLIADIRSGGLMAADSPVPMLAGVRERTNEKLAITSGNVGGSGEEEARELRAVRKREAEGRLERENLARELSDVSSRLVLAQHELERWKFEAQVREADSELLLARLSGFQIALEGAKSQLDTMQRSRSWLVTAPLRQAASLVRKNAGDLKS
jgi:SAM-dependent methyltransferase